MRIVGFVVGAGGCAVALALGGTAAGTGWVAGMVCGGSIVIAQGFWR